jgi:hypothetical protein
VAARPHPDDGFDTWLARTLLDPGRAVYSRTETEYLLREDPRITQHTLYYDILTAIANGATTPSKIGAALERPRNAVAHPLGVLESTGYIRREQDILRAKHPVITLADPVIRFNQLVTLPQAAAVEQGFAEQVWQQAAPTFNSKILGPHFEDLARDFTRRYAHTLLPGGLPGPVGTTEVADQAARTKHEVDVIALAAGERPQGPRAKIALLGEAKATAARRGTGDLERLERIRALLADQGYGTDATTLALYSLLVGVAVAAWCQQPACAGPAGRNALLPPQLPSAPTNMTDRQLLCAVGGNAAVPHSAAGTAMYTPRPCPRPPHPHAPAAPAGRQSGPWGLPVCPGEGRPGVVRGGVPVRAGSARGGT